MKTHRILTVEDIFDLGPGKLLVVPDFECRDGIGLPKIYDGLIVKNNGKTISCKIHFAVTHFNIPHSTNLSRRWRIVPELREVLKTELDVGDEIHVFDRELASRLKNDESLGSKTNSF